ncbi:hypothetical protein, partial [Tabrizicola sp.]|uniref:hypothetical protein n=1 Tax=Tabrizicola sp. TaxID=2005166 RepID=UPI00286CCCEB
MFSNLAEDIWRAFRDTPRVESDLEAVDKGSDKLVLQVRTGLKGRVLQTIHRIISTQMMTEDVRVEDG